MIVAFLVALLALALAVHLYIRFVIHKSFDDQRRTGRVDNYSRARATRSDGALPGRDNGLSSLPTGDHANSAHDFRDLGGDLGGHGSNGSNLDVHRGGSVACTELGKDVGIAAAGPLEATVPSLVEGPSTPRWSRPSALPVTPPPTVPTRKETRAAKVTPASHSSKATRSSTSVAAPISRQQFLAAFPPSFRGSPPPRQRLIAALPRPLPSSAKGKDGAHVDSPVSSKVTFTTHRAPISAMSTLSSVSTVSRSMTPGSSMTLLVQDDHDMEVDQKFAQIFYKRIIKTRLLPPKPGQDVPDVLTFAWFCSEAPSTLVQPPPDACVETPSVGDVFRHRVDECTPPAYQLFLRVLQGNDGPGWLEVDEGLRRDDGMYLIVTPATEEVSWVGESQYRSHMRKYGKFRSPLRQSQTHQ